MDPQSGQLTRIGSFDVGRSSNPYDSCEAGGTSTCYITLDKAKLCLSPREFNLSQASRNMLVVNYWNALRPMSIALCSS